MDTSIKPRTSSAIPGWNGEFNNPTGIGLLAGGTVGGLAGVLLGQGAGVGLGEGLNSLLHKLKRPGLRSSPLDWMLTGAGIGFMTLGSLAGWGGYAIGQAIEGPGKIM